MEFGWWAALYARFGVPYPVLSYAVVSLLGASLFSGVWWLTAEAYKNQQKEQRQTTEDLRPLVEDARVKLAKFEEQLKQANEATQAERAAKEHERAEKERALGALDVRAKRRELSEALGGLMVRGRQLQQRCSNEAEPAPGQDADRWATETETFLARDLGQAYVARFRSHAGLPMGGTSIASASHRNVWSFMHSRLARLEQFLQELAN